MILCGLTFVGGGAYLLVDSLVSQAENSDLSDSEAPGDSGDQDDEEIESNLWATDYTFTVIAQYKTGSGTATNATTSTSINVFHIQWQTENGSSVDWGNTGKSKNSSASVNNGAGTVDGSYFSYNFYSWGSNKRRAMISGINGYVICGISTSSSFSNTSYTSEYSYVYFYGNSSANIVTSTSPPSSSSVSSQIGGGTVYIKLRKEYTLKFMQNNEINVAKSVNMLAGIAVSTTSPTVGTGSGQINGATIGYNVVGFSETQGIMNGSYTWGLGVTVSYSASSVNRDITFHTVQAPTTYYIKYDYGGGSAGTYAPTSAQYGSVFRISNPVKTYYTFLGWTATNIDYWKTGYNESIYAKYGNSSSSVTTHWINDGGKIKAEYFLNLNSDEETVTLTANWEQTTYLLTINYYGGTTRQTNTTNLNVKPSWSSSTSSVATGKSVVLTHAKSSTQYSISMARANTGYSYYININGEPTTTNASLNTKTYYWKPNSNITISVYLRQRYKISFNANGGSGTVPGNVYKVHGYPATISTNNLTKTSYTANGWNTKADRTGTSHTTSYGYSTGNVTLYANWSPKVSTIKVQLKTSTDGTNYSNSATGGTVSVKYYYDNNNAPTQSSGVSVTSSSTTTIATNVLIDQIVTLTPKANSGYVFVGATTETTAPDSATAGTTFTPKTQNATYTLYVYFKVLSTNLLKYDSTEKYWYFEEGEYPQSYVGTSMNNTLNGASPTASGTITYNNGSSNVTIGVYTYNGKKFAKLQAVKTQTLKMSDGTSYTFTQGQWYWFEVEPIRWRVSDYGVSSTSYPSGWSAYGTYKTNFTVVSDRVLIGAVESDNVKEGWAFTSSDMYSNIRKLNQAQTSTNFSVNVSNKQSSTNYTYYKFGGTGQQDKVVSVSQTEDGVRVASKEEIDVDDYLTDYSAKASDMVCFLLGCGTDDKVEYWTRNLGVNLGNGQVVGENGVLNSCWLGNVRGVRLSLTMANGSRI